jgi:hypothetical protein
MTIAETPAAARAAVILCSLLVAACDARVPDWCRAEQGATVMLARAPSGWTEPPELVQAWRVDGQQPNRELLLPAGAAIDAANGRIAVVDFRLGQVALLGTDGRWIGRRGRRGDGPGEVRTPIAAAWRDEGQLVVYDAAHSKLVVFDRSGAPSGDEPANPDFTAALGGGVAWLGMGADGTLLARPTAFGRGDERSDTYVVLRAHAAGSAVDTLARVTAPIVTGRVIVPVPAPGWPLPHAAVSPTGRIALAGETADYRIDVFERDSLVLRICRRVEPLPLPRPSESIRQWEAPPSVIAALEAAPRPERHAAIGRVAFDAAGRLWVQRDLPHALSIEDTAIGRAGALFDVYDDAGTYLGPVRMPERVRFLGATAELIVGLEGAADEVFSIVGFRPRW